MAILLMSPGHFETLRTYGGVPTSLDRHLWRLEAAEPALDTAAVASEVARVLAEREGESMIRIEVRRGATTVEASDLPAHVLGDPTQPLSAVIAEVPGYAYPRKSLEREVQTTLHEQATAVGAFDAIIVDQGVVIESTRANVLVISNDQLITPQLGRCLSGVTRSLVLECASAVGLEVHEDGLDVESMFSGDEILLSNALIGIRSLDAIDGRAVGGRAPAALGRLRQEYLR